MWQEYINVTSIENVTKILGQKRERARIIACATDLILELERGVRKGIETVIDVTRIPNLDSITIDEDVYIHIAPLVTQYTMVASQTIQYTAYPPQHAYW